MISLSGAGRGREAVQAGRRRLLKGLSMALAAIGMATALLPGSADAQPKLKVLLTSTSFAWLPLYVADGAGYFKDEKIDLEISYVKDGAVVLSGIMTGNAEIAGIGANSLFAARAREQPIKLLTPMNTEYTSTIFGRRKALEEKGITEKSTIEEKIAALKGLKIGVVNINSGVHLLFRSLMQTYGKADLDKVSEVVPVGDAGATLAAMSRGLIDVTAFSPPVPQQAVKEGYAMILLDPIRGDIPSTRGMVFTAMATTEDIIAKRPADLEAFVRAIGRANDLIRTDIGRAGAAARKHFPTMNQDLFDAAMTAMIPATPKTPENPIDGLKAYYEMLRAGGEKFAQGPFDFEKSVANDLVRRAVSGKAR